MFKIGAFSKLSRISIRMLRHYDEIGLLVPEQVDDFTGYRYYSAAQLAAAGRIRMLREMGFGLPVIGEILARYSDPESLRGYLSIRLSQMREEARVMRERMSFLENTLERSGKDGNYMNYSVTLKEFPAMWVVSLRETISRYEDEGRLWKTMYEEIAPLNVRFAANPCYSMAVFYDEGFQESDVDVEIRSAVAGSYPNTAHVICKEAPPVTAATVTIVGDYSGVSAACEAVGNWTADNGWEMDGPMFNIYHVSPAAEPDPAKWVTEICFPVKRV